LFTGIGLLENGSRKKHTLEHDRFKAVETHDMNQDHEFGHKVSIVYIVMFYHFERFQLWIFKGCVFFSLGEWFVLPIAIVAGIKKNGGSPSHHGFFSHYVMVDFVG
jgi:hypothetical protein